MPRSTTHPMWELAKARRLSYRPWRKDNVRVTIAMRDHFAAVDGQIRLDSLLHYCQLQDLVEDARSRGISRADFPKTVWSDMPLPLAKTSIGQGRDYKKIYYASFACFTGVQSVTRWKKRWEDEHDDIVTFGKKQPVVIYKNGWSKNYDMPLVVHSTKELVFYARGVGSEIERLLKTYLTHVGKKASQGYGRVGEIVVDYVENDWSVWRDGKPMRPIPAEMVEVGRREELVYSYCGYRPPYWMPEHQHLCAVDLKNNYHGATSQVNFG